MSYVLSMLRWFRNDGRRRVTSAFTVTRTALTIRIGVIMGQSPGYRTEPPVAMLEIATLKKERVSH
jgi:hypothetical protein